MHGRVALLLGLLIVGEWASWSDAADPPYPPRPASLIALPPLSDQSAPHSTGYAPRDAGPRWGLELDCKLPSWCEGGRFVGGAGFYYMVPYFENNPALFMVTAAGPASGQFFTSSAAVEFGHELTFSPLVWVGYMTPGGLGARTRWWRFDQNARLAAVNSSPDGASTAFHTAAPLGLGFATSSGLQLTGPIVYESNLKLDVWDFEAVQSMDLGAWTLLMGGGFRCVQLAQEYNAARSVSGTLGSTIYQQDANYLLSGHNFRGAGPVIAFEVRRPFEGTGLAVFANTRGALLFGKGKQRAASQSIQTGQSSFPGFDPPFAPVLSPFDSRTVNLVSSSWNDVRPVAEMEIGVEYGWNIGQAYFFVQTAFVGQVWWGADGAARSSSAAFGFAGPGPIVPSNLGSADSNLGFLGLSVRAGIQF